MASSEKPDKVLLTEGYRGFRGGKKIENPKLPGKFAGRRFVSTAPEKTEKPAEEEG